MYSRPSKTRLRLLDSTDREVAATSAPISPRPWHRPAPEVHPPSWRPASRGPDFDCCWAADLWTFLTFGLKQRCFLVTKPPKELSTFLQGFQEQPRFLAGGIGRECGNEPRDFLKGNHQLDGFTRVIPFFHSLPIAPSSVCLSLGCGMTRGLSNHVCDTFANLPLYLEGEGVVFGKPFLWYHRSGFHFPQPWCLSLGALLHMAGSKLSHQVTAGV